MEDNLAVDATGWLRSALRNPDVIDTERWVVMEIAQSPGRLWSPGDLIELVETDSVEVLVEAAEAIRRALDELIGLGLLEVVVSVEFEREDMLFRILT
ncbi:MAG: hypothetical protein JST91_00805 [Actinobacteria bacterium]|nr:hypothetical protein [Actinomycetota bacterium]